MFISRSLIILIYFIAASCYSLIANDFSAHFFLLPTEIQLTKNQLINKKEVLTSSTYKSDTTSFSCNSLSAIKLTNKQIAVKKQLVENEPIEIRLAVLTTPQYAQYFIDTYKLHDNSIDEQKQFIKQAIQKSIDEVNLVLHRDLNVKLNLIENIETLIYISQDSIFSSIRNHTDVLSIAEKLIPTKIRSEDYDIGHVFSTILGGASRRASAFTDYKWQGSTGATTPEGKIFNIDYFAHEIGHQLGASHTQSADCSRDSESSVEVSSGISIMSYAGICSLFNSNVSHHSAPFFHAFSIEQIQENLSNYYDRLSNENNLILNAIPNFTIPVDTPFKIDLKTQNNISKILFNCEQVNNDPYTARNSAITENDPSFISPELSYENVIYFPSKMDVINNQLHGKFSSLSTSHQEYQFLATARTIINNIQNYSEAYFKVTTVGNNSFKITSQQQNSINWLTGNEYTITWNANESSLPPVNCKSVNIFLALDGLNFDYEVVQNLPNSGTFEFTIPKGIQSNSCRIKIEAADNIFYAVNKTPFLINKASNTIFTSSKNGSQKNDSNYMNVPTDFKESGVEVSLKLKEGIYENLYIELISPDNQSFQLINLACETRLHKVDATFTSSWYSPSKKSFEYDLCLDELVGKYPFKSNYTTTKTSGEWQLKLTNRGKFVPEAVLSWQLKFNGTRDKQQNKDIGTDTIIFPNPANKYFTTRGILLNSLGKVVHYFDFEQRVSTTTDISHLPQGIYFLKIAHSDLDELHKIIIN